MQREARVAEFMDGLSAKANGQDAFLQAVRHVVEDTITIEKAHSDWATAKVLERLSEPDRIIGFRVVWQDDAGEIQVNRGWRVQYSNAIGPYKGGLRFHPTVSPSILKFLGFEQTFKNALTGLPLGGAKGGADFDPRGRSENEIMRFCQAFMGQLVHFIGPDQDVPAGDINVGTREIGWLFAAYKAHAARFHGALTGKGQSFGGSEMRVEATGYGLVYFVEAMLADRSEDLGGKRVAISGKGNVATHAALKAAERGATVVTLSDTSGTLVAEDGLDTETIRWVQERKATGGDIAEPPKGKAVTFKEGGLPWSEEVDIALPCATQNEMDGDMAQQLVDGGARIVAEGANMPLTDDAAAVLRKAGITHAPGKAANAGGVAVSGLEMSQNAHRQFSSAEAVDSALKEIMGTIHGNCVEEGREGDRVDYRRGANVAAFRKVASAVSAMGAL